MSQENVEIVIHGFSLYNSGDREAVLDLYDANIEWRDLDHAPDVPERFVGIEGLRELVATWDAAFDDLRRAEVYELEGGKIVRVTIYPDRSAALEVMGRAE